jgi:hypothetical protein
MNHLLRNAKRVSAGCAVAALIVSLAGCGGSATSPSDQPQLRVLNAGAASAAGLRILFPAEEITFGNVSAGGTSAYLTVTKGVYRYGAFRLEINGQMVTQPVIDWVGEKPMDGRAFTYTIDVDPSRPMIVRLIDVTRDR